MGMKNGGISSIYTSGQLLHEAWSRKGKTKRHIARINNNKKDKNVRRREQMAYVKLGKETLFKNKEATEGNKQPHFRGNVTVEYDIPAGAQIGLAGWLNEKGDNKSLFFALSCKEEELQKEGRVVEMDLDEVKAKFERNR
tara:strand:+ start:340 stop:759 length:420 start_codon:yes stop_codon:yes gene_type:complete